MKKTFQKEKFHIFVFNFFCSIILSPYQRIFCILNPYWFFKFLCNISEFSNILQKVKTYFFQFLPLHSLLDSCSLSNIECPYVHKSCSYCLRTNGISLLEYQAMPSLTWLMTDGCVHLLHNSRWKFYQLAAGQLRYGTEKADRARPSRTKSHLPGHSPLASQAERHVGPALYPSASLVQILSFRPVQYSLPNWHLALLGIAWDENYMNYRSMKWTSVLYLMYFMQVEIEVSLKTNIIHIVKFNSSRIFPWNIYVYNHVKWK